MPDTDLEHFFIAYDEDLSGTIEVSELVDFLKQPIHMIGQGKRPISRSVSMPAPKAAAMSDDEAAAERAPYELPPRRTNGAGLLFLVLGDRSPRSGAPHRPSGLGAAAETWALYRLYLGREAVVLSTGTPIPAQWTRRRRCRDRGLGAAAEMWAVNALRGLGRVDRRPSSFFEKKNRCSWLRASFGSGRSVLPVELSRARLDRRLGRYTTRLLATFRGMPTANAEG